MMLNETKKYLEKLISNELISISGDTIYVFDKAKLKSYPYINDYGFPSRIFFRNGTKSNLRSITWSRLAYRLRSGEWFDPNKKVMISDNLIIDPPE